MTKIMNYINNVEINISNYDNLDEELISLKKCIDQYVNNIKKLRPAAPIKKIREFVFDEITDSLQDTKCEFNDGAENKEVSLISVIKWIEKYRPIISGYGAFYQKHDKAGTNRDLGLILALLDRRSDAKKEMFNHINDNDKTLFNNYKLLQLVYKLLANSFYGVFTESNSHFYDPYNGSAITFSGQDITSTAIVAFEGFIAGNIEFYDLDDVINYVNLILNEEYEYEDIITRHISNDKLISWLIKKCKFELTDDDILNITYMISQMSQLEMDKIYYKNNIFAFLKNKKILKKFKTIVEDSTFLDPNDPNEELEKKLNKIWIYIKEWVSFNYSEYERLNRSINGKRKVTLTIDTDSTFLYVKKFHDFFKSNYIEEINNNSNNKITSINIGTYFITKYIENVFERLTRTMQIPEDQRWRIRMKNEFLYSRIMLTPNKKNYSGMILMQEGKILKGDQNPDIKGLPIKKVSVNYNIRNYFQKLLKDDILTSEAIDRGKIYTKFLELKNIIRLSLEKGKTEYCIPGRANEIDTYKTPYQIQSIRGVVLWNCLFPNEEITLPNKVNLLKLTIEDLNSIATLESEYYEKIKSAVFDDPNLAKYGAKILAIPKTVDKIPKWIIPYIDYDTIINDQIKSGIILLNSLGFKNIELTSGTFISNIIEI